MGMLDGLLDFNNPQVGAAWGLLSGQANLPQVLAQMQATQAAQQNRKMGDLQMQQMQAQMQQQQEAQQRAQQLRVLQSQFFQPGQPGIAEPPPELGGGPGLAPTAPRNDVRGYAQSALSQGLMDPMQAAQLGQKEQPKYHVVGGALVPEPQGGGPAKPVYEAPKEQWVDFGRDPKTGQALQKNSVTGQVKAIGSVAPQVNVNAGTKSFWQSTGDELGKQIVNDLTAAKSGVETVRQAHSIMSAIDGGGVMAGPGANVKLKLAQIPAVLGLPTNEQGIVQTRNVIKGLANLTLASRDALKGQGQITDRETDLLERARSGDIELTPAEIRRVAELAEMAGRISIGRNSANLKRMKETPDAASLVNFFSLDEPAPYAPKRRAGDQEIDSLLKKYLPNGSR